jgi:hypothetical protein
VKIVYVRLLPMSGMSLWPFILIREARRGDDALIAHERVHFDRQGFYGRWWPLRWGLRYIMSRDFRFHEEVLGYRAQIAAGGIGPDKAARALSGAWPYFTFKTIDECFDALVKD